MNGCQENNFYQYDINKDNIITSICQDFLRFAEQNDYLLKEARILNSPLFDFIEGDDTRYMNSVLINRVRETKIQLTVPFRCDSQDHRRYMEMSIIPLEDDGLRFKNFLVKSEKKQDIVLSNLDTHKSIDVISMCSWCNRFKVTNTQWEEADIAVRELGLFGDNDRKRITHGICQTCSELIMTAEG
ncbi:hypothetical protein [Oceanicoccus sagamiensis]|uniref:Uncharacterized protein n=1 Tax=Oceanicoccus sagamiensis TaxID=716816 RepID=A0A1X9NFI3_9GAMM|nr:hypothetical protein [Oceanicoccus sagamiensis]ARN74279.1 hypothetical protein BST96_09180 [Oceanicoccus sagamiensis]